MSWDHDLGYWGQYWRISILLYQLMQHILPLLVPAHQDWEKSEQRAVVSSLTLFWDRLAVDPAATAAVAAASAAKP